ncbi:hypothetical protein C7S17_4767 [Burkholderia thailandensis]|nr:hypothetical protein [Burkholderia thailandensis]
MPVLLGVKVGGWATAANEPSVSGAPARRDSGAIDNFR